MDACGVLHVARAILIKKARCHSERDRRFVPSARNLLSEEPPTTSSDCLCFSSSAYLNSSISSNPNRVISLLVSDQCTESEAGRVGRGARLLRLALGGGAFFGVGDECGEPRVAVEGIEVGVLVDGQVPPGGKAVVNCLA